MKRLFCILSILSIQSVAFAFATPAMPSQFPSNSNWAKAMTKRACKVTFKKSDYGTIQKKNGGVVYRVYDSSNQLIAVSTAPSTLIFAKKRCLKK